VSSSRVPAGGEVSSKVPDRGVFRCQRTEPRGGWRKDRDQLATTNKRAIARAFEMPTRLARDRDVTNCGFPHQRHKPRKPRPTLTQGQTQ